MCTDLLGGGGVSAHATLWQTPPLYTTPHPREQNDTCLWKHYLPRYAVGNEGMYLGYGRLAFVANSELMDIMPHFGRLTLYTCEIS